MAKRAASALLVHWSVCRSFEAGSPVTARDASMIDFGRSTTLFAASATNLPEKLPPATSQDPNMASRSSA